MKKRVICLLLALTLILSLSACGKTKKASYDGPTVEFTDSAGRTVEVPETIERIVPSGPLAQIVLFSLCPDKLVALATDWAVDAEEYLDTDYYNLPVLGQLYGGTADLNMEELMKYSPEIIIDVGQTKTDIGDDLDTLQEQTGIPCVHIAADLDTMADAYTMLGELLGMEDEAAERADFCTEVYSMMLDIMDQVGDDRASVLYCLGDLGTNVICTGSYQSAVLDLLTNNLAEVDSPSSKGTGNEVNMEQLYVWNPDYIFFGPESYYEYAADDPAWQEITAIQTGQFYEVPHAVYCWMGFPPSVQRYMGMLWMAKILYPEYATYDLYEEISTFYQLFLHCDLTRDQYDALVANSVGKLDLE